jgi:hypothetical protein
MAAQYPLLRALEVIVAEQPEDSAKIVKGVFVSVEKGLVGRATIGPKSRAAHHAAQRAHLQLDLRATEFRPLQTNFAPCKFERLNLPKQD